MTVAVVVIAAGRRTHLVRTLAGLAAQTTPADHVVVVDMEPECSVADIVVAPARCLPLPATGHRLPLAAARNAGAAAVGSDQLIFLDVDCIAAADLVERYVEVLTAHPTALACGPVRYLRRDWDAGSSDGTLLKGAELKGASDSHPSRTAPRGRHVRLGDDHELFWSLSFGCAGATWTKIGGFDEGYRGYGAEDTDFAYRARRLSVPLAWFAGGTAYHQWHAPSRFDDAHLPDIVANARRFHDRWGSWPMTGWLEELQRRGRIDFDPARGRLDMVPAP